MQKMKKNCWEVKHCGTERSCPAFIDKRLDGIHGGINAGRWCWVVAGTLCFGKPVGKYAQKIDTCEKCAFYQLVQQEESENFSLVFSLLRSLKEKS